VGYSGLDDSLMDILRDAVTVPLVARGALSP
jgi:hypothetical protein